MFLCKVGKQGFIGISWISHRLGRWIFGIDEEFYVGAWNIWGMRHAANVWVRSGEEADDCWSMHNKEGGKKSYA